MLAVTLTLLCAACMENDIVAPEEIEDPADFGTYYPGRNTNWDIRTAVEAGWDAASLDEAVQFAVANATPTGELAAALQAQNGEFELTGPLKERGGPNGIILHRGYILAEWGDTARSDMVFDVASALLSTAIGLAVDRGMIQSVDDPVAGYVSDNGYASMHNTPITWRQGLQQTSEWVGEVFARPDIAGRIEEREPQAPGSVWEPNEARLDRLGLSATLVWGEFLGDVIDREVLTPLGASRSWRWQGYRDSGVEIADQDIETVAVSGRWGGGLWISSRDLARFGLLYQRGGLWREDQLISSEYLAASLIPSEIEKTQGFLWRVNTESALWPAAPAESFGTFGFGENFLWIDPSREIVVVVRWLAPENQNELIEHVLAAAR
ncbi:MAG: serine hydrolase [Acidobacteria bacterium]|nr:serine hydrolase [Acidobacteriota bacterium]